MDPVHFREANFEWLPEPGQSGVALKSIGSFTERGVAVYFVRIDAGASYTIAEAPQTQLLFIKSGSGKFGTGESWSLHTAAHLGAGESVPMHASTLTEVMVLQLPRLG